VEASIRCLQGLSCVLCSEPHESCQLQLLLNFTTPVNITLSLGLSTQLYHLSGATTEIAYVFQPLCLFPSVAPTESLCFQPISLFLSSAPIETLYFSQLTSLHFRRSNRNFTSLNSSLSSLQVFQLKLYVCPFFFLLLPFG
jgi:hypothetical protein